ncbi:hypothetical protein V3C99_005550 [Haemonchus contortus]
MESTERTAASLRCQRFEFHEAINDPWPPGYSMFLRNQRHVLELSLEVGRTHSTTSTSDEMIYDPSYDM